MSNRRDHVKVSLNDQALARLDEFRGDDERAVYLRRLLHEPSNGAQVATHIEALTILTRLARDHGSRPRSSIEKAPWGDQSSTSELEEFLRGT